MPKYVSRLQFRLVDGNAQTVSTLAILVGDRETAQRNVGFYLTLAVNPVKMLFFSSAARARD